MDGCVRGRGGETETILTQRRWAALMYAAEDGHTNTVQLLVELGAKVEATDNNGQTGA